MANAIALSRDPKRRHMTLLAAASAVAIALAAAAVFQQSSSTAPQFQQHPFFPGLADKLPQLGEIAITTKSGGFHVRLQQGKWVIPERDNFPADSSQLRSTALGLADLTVLEPKTGRADWLSFVGLTAPDKGGEATAVKVSDTNGKSLGDLLIGHTEGGADALGRNTVYVRHPDENQSWLARGSLTLKTSVTDWLDRNVLTIARDRIKGASVTPEKGAAYELSRDNKDQPDFKLLNLPQGRSLSFEGSPDGVAGAIASFTFDDVAKADQFDFSKAPQNVEHTFDGLDVTVKIATRGMEHWATVTAAGSNATTEAEAAKINATVGGWAFKLPDDKVTQFISDRETLLKPVDEKATVPAAPAKK